MIFYFWQNMVAMHQVHCLKSLARRHDVHLLVDREINADRATQGWSKPDTGLINVRVVDVSEVTQIIENSSRDSIHIFAPRGCLTGRRVLKEVRRLKRRYGLLMEVPDGSGVRLLMKRILYVFLAWACRDAEFTLAMGDRGVLWYKRVGFPRCIPFSYTVANSANRVELIDGDVYRFICVARLIPLKRHADLFRALSTIECSWTLDCVGDGPLSDELHEYAKELKIDDRINWIASVDNSSVRIKIAESDTLVLCSEWEGWGAVINEAIAEGTRVITSNAPGAACLLSLGDVGDVFKSGDVDALASLLQGHLDRGKVSRTERELRKALHDKINGDAMAFYFETLVAGGSFPAPWGG